MEIWHFGVFVRLAQTGFRGLLRYVDMDLRGPSSPDIDRPRTGDAVAGVVVGHDENRQIVLSRDAAALQSARWGPLTERFDPAQLVEAILRSTDESGRSPLGVDARASKFVPLVDDVGDLGRARLAPVELRYLWLHFQEAYVLEGRDGDRSGLHLFSPAACQARSELERVRRRSETRNADLVIGELLDNDDLLVYLTSGRQELLIAGPGTRRAGWTSVGEELCAFVERFIEAGGERFWA
ncbi:hypothetical protein KSP35_17295 [Aquihabitans sp. G128]|uniref:hypothetical protein n=1 Tax=Aquihabitans sp. G128 TaxID=2849779 RepID=UPI001C2215FF|nr:hypothetical protein KSP35_17295 [Aquihabitans sp. G128]